MRRALLRIGATDLENQPLPDRPRTADRYELLAKLQGVLRSLGFGGLVVLVDRGEDPAVRAWCYLYTWDVSGAERVMSGRFAEVAPDVR